MGKIRRKFEVEFKRRLVEQIETGQMTLSAAARQYQISPSVIQRWRTQYEANQLVDRPSSRERALEAENERLKAKVGDLVMQIDHQKKTAELDEAESKRRYCRNHWEKLGSISKGCEMTGLARSTYYYRPKVDPKLKAQQDADLRDRIERIQAEFPGYGYRRVYRELERQGEIVNTKRLRRVMKRYGLKPITWRSFLHTTDSNHRFRIYPNLLKRHTVTGLNQAWAADITYIRIRTGFVFLAAILDLHSRKVIGWAISKRIDRQLCIEALQMAIAARLDTRGCIHHSDRGVQYASDDYIDILRTHGFQISMSAKGNPGDNAFVESFFKTLKYEEIHLWNYETYEDVIERVPYFIEEVYNRKRLHSSIGYRPPIEFEQLVNLKRADRPILNL